MISPALLDWPSSVANVDSEARCIMTNHGTNSINIIPVFASTCELFAAEENGARIYLIDLFNDINQISRVTAVVTAFETPVTVDAGVSTRRQ